MFDANAAPAADARPAMRTIHGIPNVTYDQAAAARLSVGQETAGQIFQTMGYGGAQERQRVSQALSMAAREAGQQQRRPEHLQQVIVRDPQLRGQTVQYQDEDGNIKTSFIRDDEAMHKMHEMLGKFFQVQGDRSKPLAQDLVSANGFALSHATQEDMGRLMTQPSQNPSLDNIPGIISNMNPDIQKRGRDFRSFMENVPVNYVKELRHPTSIYRGVPQDPMINAIHLESQRRRLESIYAFI